MANLILTQTQNAAGCGAVVGCSGATIAATPQAREATKDGSAGVTELEILIALGATQAGIMFQSADNEPGKTTWNAGDWVVRLNVTTGSDRINWVATYVCRFNNACGSLAVVGSLTGQSISCELTGVKQMTVAGAEQSANLSDEIYIVLIFQNTFTHGAKGIGFTPDQNIDSPIVITEVTPKSVSDSGSGADSIGVKVKAILSDSGGGADDIAKLKALLALADSGVGAENVFPVSKLAVGDSGSGVDSLTAILAKLTIQDSGLGADTLAAIKVLLSLLDSGGGVDVLIVRQFRDVADNGTGAESVASKVAIGVTESGSGAEALSILSKLLVQESGSGLDTIVLVKAILNIIDSGLGTETIKARTSLSILDSGGGAELVSILTKLFISDVASGVDSIKVDTEITQKSVQDSAIGADLISTFTKILISDSGLGNDLASLIQRVSIQDPAAGIDIARILISYLVEGIRKVTLDSELTNLVHSVDSKIKKSIYLDSIIKP